MLGKEVACLEAQRAASLHDAAGASAELQQQVEQLKLEAAQAGRPGAMVHVDAFGTCYGQSERQVPDLRSRLAEMEVSACRSLTL